MYGGQPIERQSRVLRKREVQIVIGTPGRIMDHMRRGTMSMEDVEMLVLDEADEMLDMGFRDDIESIQIPGQRQTILFSATMSRDTLNLAEKYQNRPRMIKLVHREMTVPGVEQFYYEVKQQAKTELLSRIIDVYNLRLSLVFCNTKRCVDELAEGLQIRGYIAEGLHGDMQQKQREHVMRRYRREGIEVLVATDVVARGIDVGETEAVFNYDMPTDDENYVHRIGRTARAENTGRAFTFVTGREVHRIERIQKFTFTKSRIRAQPIPDVNDVREIRVSQLLQRIRETIDVHLSEYSNLVERLLEEDYASLDIAAALLKLAISEEAKKGGIGSLIPLLQVLLHPRPSGARFSVLARLRIWRFVQHVPCSLHQRLASRRAGPQGRCWQP